MCAISVYFKQVSSRRTGRLGRWRRQRGGNWTGAAAGLPCCASPAGLPAALSSATRHAGGAHPLVPRRRPASVPTPAPQAFAGPTRCPYSAHRRASRAAGCCRRRVTLRRTCHQERHQRPCGDGQPGIKPGWLNRSRGCGPTTTSSITQQRQSAPAAGSASASLQVCCSVSPQELPRFDRCRRRITCSCEHSPCRRQLQRHRLQLACFGDGCWLATAPCCSSRGGGLQPCAHDPGTPL